LSGWRKSLSLAVRVFLDRVVAERAMPFAIKAPNPATRAAMEENRAVTHARYETPGFLFDAFASKGE